MPRSVLFNDALNMIKHIIQYGKAYGPYYSYRAKDINSYNLNLSQEIFGTRCRGQS
jgi:hypothetical protein